MNGTLVFQDQNKNLIWNILNTTGHLKLKFWVYIKYWRDLTEQQ